MPVGELEKLQVAPLATLVSLKWWQLHRNVKRAAPMQQAPVLQKEGKVRHTEPV